MAPKLLASAVPLNPSKPCTQSTCNYPQPGPLRLNRPRDHYQVWLELCVLSHTNRCTTPSQVGTRSRENCQSKSDYIKPPPHGVGFGEALAYSIGPLHPPRLAVSISSFTVTTPGLDRHVQRPSLAAWRQSAPQHRYPRSVPLGFAGSA